MSTTRGTEPLSDPPALPPAPSAAGQSDGPVGFIGSFTRRKLLLLAGSGVAGGLIARRWIEGSGSTTSGLPTASGVQHRPDAPLFPRPMEEEPLPRDVHLPLARADAPAPAADLRLSSSSPAASSTIVTDTAKQPLPQMAPPVLPEVAKPASVPLSEPAFPAKLASPAPVPVAPGPTATVAAVPRSSKASWLRNARPLVETGSMPAIAIVIDDLGLSAVHTHQAIALDRAVNLAFMTYAPLPEAWIGRAQAAQHEILVHVPMQPLNDRIDPGPRALTVSLSDAEILERLRWGLGRMDGYVGINNHMGSRFTQDRPGMSVVMAEVEARGLLYLDSVTIGRTVCGAAAAPLRVPFAERNVFLDDEATVAGVSRQIAVLEKFARRQGSAIAIGHPHPATLSVLAEWLPSAAARGFRVVPLTSVMRRKGLKA